MKPFTLAFVSFVFGSAIQSSRPSVPATIIARVTVASLPLATTLAVVDYRGYGQSTGTPTLRASIGDAIPVLDAALKFVRRRHLVVMGRSLGGALAAAIYFLIGRTLRPKVSLPSYLAVVYGSAAVFLFDHAGRPSYDGLFFPGR